MSPRSLFRGALMLAVLALLLPVLNSVVQVVEDETMVSVSRWALYGAGGLAALAVLIFVLQKLRLVAVAGHCADCGKRIQHGQSYCYDHQRLRKMRADESSRHGA